MIFHRELTISSFSTTSINFIYTLSHNIDCTIIFTSGLLVYNNHWNMEPSPQLSTHIETSTLITAQCWKKRVNSNKYIAEKRAKKLAVCSQYYKNQSFRQCSLRDHKYKRPYTLIKMADSICWFYINFLTCMTYIMRNCACRTNIAIKLQHITAQTCTWNSR